MASNGAVRTGHRAPWPESEGDPWRGEPHSPIRESYIIFALGDVRFTWSAVAYTNSLYNIRVAPASSLGER